MKKTILCCVVLILSTTIFVACGGTNVESSEESDIPQTEGLSENVSNLTPEEKYDYVYSYFTEGDSAAKGRHSMIAKAKYLFGASAENQAITMMYMSDDSRQGVLLYLDKAGNLNVTVNIKSDNEGVVGTANIKASDYTYGYEFDDFTYDANGNNWNYDNFRIRANAYVRDTVLYADSILQDYLEIGLQEIGFTSWESPGIFTEEYISADDIAGMWDYRSPDSQKYSSRLFLTGDKIYWRGYEEYYADAITASAMTEDASYVLSQGITMSDFDPWTGEVLVSDDYIGNDSSTHEEFRRYIYRDQTETLCMRVESVCFGLSNSEDGKVYVKMEDETKVSITPSIYDPTSADLDQSEESLVVTEEQEKSDGNNGESHAISDSSYQSILDDYTVRMEDAIDGLVREYKSESSGISDINQLAEICNDKIGKLAEICNEGIGEMADLMYSNGDAYSVYESWAGKLQDNYSDIAMEIQDAYLESAMN